MAVINVTPGTECILTLGNTAALAVPAAAGSMVVPLMQDVTINASPGIVRYSTLDSPSSSAFTTVNENSVSLNMLLDEETFFGLDTAGNTNKIADDGLFKVSTDKTEVFFSVSFQGTQTGDHLIKGKGFISGLAPTASMDAAVWLTPMEIVVNGELEAAASA